MPFRAQKSLLNLDPSSIEAIDTRNVIDLHGLWSVLHKCADAMENGKRLENLSWRLFSREAFCCAPARSLSPHAHLDRKRHIATLHQVPELSSSVDSTSSDSDTLELAPRSSKSLPTRARPELMRNPSAESGARKEKHITSIDLEKIVASIKTRKALTPLSPLPAALTPAEPVIHTAHETTPSEPKPELAPAPQQDSTSQPTTLPPTSNPTPFHILDSSTSTVATDDFSVSDMSPPLASSETTGTDVSATSIVRGFSKDHISCSARSQTNLLPTPTPSGSILKSSAAYRAQAASKPRKKGATFHLGASSEEGDSSFESSYLHGRSPLGDALRRSKKTTSFNEEVSTREIKPSKNYEAVFEDSDEEEEDEQSSSAIEDDDVEEDWEDEEEQSVPSSVNERELFQRVDSKPNLVSRRSLLTSMMHEKDRAAALQNAASRSTPAIRRSRTSSPNGPLNSHTEVAATPSIAQGLEASRARPIIMTTSNVHPPALSPRTNRRNMLSTELTESLRKHILWDRQVNRSTTNAARQRNHNALKRNLTAQDMTRLQHFPTENQPRTYMPSNVPQSTVNSWKAHNFFDSGLQEYHQRGW